ncbi:hypothetical protein PISMIDRAFT_7706 [Pisolithus microcarpus 441]|uniref:Uncharacterized protein n=1 Tax=Pisolithus microcarpus 441 TaxID=765257 RepID=A0A0C9YT94_9AGAM|nr:hypothetical protein PISMIDRAFT_7706 [Pisolithus microcarpus 441]
MVKQVEDLQDEYYATKDSSERLALEEDIVGKVLRCGISLGVRYVLVKESSVLLLFLTS